MQEANHNYQNFNKAITTCIPLPQWIIFFNMNIIDIDFHENHYEIL